MSIYARNFVMDEETGEPKLIKHLNQKRIDRCYAGTPPGKWNKTGKKRRMRDCSKSSIIKMQIKDLKKWKGIDLNINGMRIPT